MPVRTNEEPVQLTRFFWKVEPKNGLFSTSFLEDDGSGNKTRKKITANEIEGKLSSVFTAEDKGNEAEGIDPHTKGVITIFDQEAIHQLSMRLDTNFCASLACRLRYLKRGDTIRVRLRKGKKKNVTFAEVQCQTPSGEWVNVAWEPALEGDRTPQVTAIFEQHSAKHKHDEPQPSTTPNA
jgi:hypothetical protein